MYTISVDAGGTMTDAIVSGKGDLITLKVDSTPHDLTVSLMNCLGEAASRLGFDGTRDLLSEVSLIRWSSTVTSNALGELRGAKIGLIVAHGFEDSLYGDGPSPAVGSIVARENIVGIESNIEAADLVDAIKRMLRRGVRRICICLPGSYPDNAEECRLKAIVNHQYPDHFVGSVPVVLGSEIAQTPDDMTRAHCALINAYVHPPLAASLFKAEDRLKDEGAWNGPLLIGHINGGMARVAKTLAIDTIESGPVFGFFGAGAFARLYGLPTVLCLDVGGTTAKASVVKGGEPMFHRQGDLFGIPLRMPIAMLRSASVGGGSIAGCGGDKQLQVGPESMGSSPGPACYGLGGGNATVTDALVVSGCLDPRGFHGGKRVLDTALSAEAIRRHVAEPLGLSVEAAAEAIRQRAVAIVADLTASTAAEAGVALKQTVLFATGGNGPLFAPFVAEQVGISTVYVFFQLGPVFSAFGCSTSDVLHTYRKVADLPLSAPSADRTLADTVEELRARAIRDLAGEGFDPAKATFSAEFEVTAGANDPLWVSLGLNDGGDLVAQLAAAWAKEGGVTRDRHASVQLVVVKATYPIERIVPAEVTAAPAGDARPGTRTLLLGQGPAPAAVHDWTSLAPGQRIGGPAIIAGGDITAIVPAGWTLTVDRYGNGVLTR